MTPLINLYSAYDQRTFKLTVGQNPAELRFGIGLDGESKAALQALVMGKHTRLGAKSCIRNIPDDVLMAILLRIQSASLHIPALNLSLYDLKAGSQRIYVVSKSVWHAAGPTHYTYMQRVRDSLLAQHLHTELCTRQDPVTADLHEDQEYGHTLTLHKAGDVGTMRLHFDGPNNK